MPPNDGTVVMEGVQIIFRNFEGKEGQYNKKGDRNFGVLLDQQTADDMLADDWNIKYLKPREDEEVEEGEQPQAWLPVALKYDAGRPPKVVVLTSRGRTNLGENEVEMLDWAEITNVDLIVRPYHWEVSGKTGVKAYLQSMFVTIEEDALEQKYAALDSQ